MACKLEEAVQEINKLLALPTVNKEKMMVDKLNLAKQSIEAQMKVLGAQVKPDEKINISSGTKGLPGALTNHTVLSKKKGSIESDYPIEFNGTKYDSVESAYQGNKVDESKTKPAKEDSQNYKLMVELIGAKFANHPRLVGAVTKLGGLKYLENAVHQPTSKNTVWETGGQDWFMSAMKEAYNNAIAEPVKVVEQIEEIKVEAAFTKSDLSWVMTRLAEGLDAEAIKVLNTNKAQAVVELDNEIKQFQKELDVASSENDKETVREFAYAIKNLNNAKEQLKEENAEVSSTFFKRDGDSYYTKEKTNYRKVFIPSEGVPKDKMKDKNILNSLFAAIRSDLSFGDGIRDIHDMFSKYSDIYTKEIKEFIEVKSSLDKGTREMKDIAEWEDFAKEYIANEYKLIELFNKEAEKHGLPKPRQVDPVDNYEFGFSAQFLKESTKQEVGKMTTNKINEMALKCAKQG